jgi:PAS domain S-box-containing protein
MPWFQNSQMTSSIPRSPNRSLPLFPADLLAAIVESSDDAIISKTLDGVILSWNAAAERLFGYTSDEAVGQPITLIIPRERHGEEAEILAKLRRGERVDHYETVRMAKDGRLIDISVTSSPVRDRDGVILGASKVARDITTRKQTEALIREANRKLEAADRAKAEFLATLAHELRNPLAPIRNAVFAVRLSGEDLSRRVDWALTLIDRQTQQLTRLVEDLLDLSRIDNNRFELRCEPLDFKDVVQAAVEISAPAIQAAGHELEVTVPDGPIPLTGDSTRLAQVISNLLNNAAKFTPSPDRIKLTAESKADQVIVSVRDHGVGIPAEKVQVIFDMFAQVDSSLTRENDGLGIGLTLVKRLVELHGGNVTAFSQGLGTGSTFTVRLPRTGPRSDSPLRAS